MAATVIAPAGTLGVRHDLSAASVYTASVPTRLSRLAPTHAVYVRRRLVVCAFALAFVSSAALATQQGLADRGNDPAFVSAAGRAMTYVVRPGDTLWSIAEQVRHGKGLADYVDALVSVNGGSKIIVGQLLRLP